MEVSGVLILDKPQGITSQTAVNKVRRAFGTKRVGHTGTLDPMATGVLPVLVGSAVKASELLTAENKSYKAGLKLGLCTDTLDVTGAVTYRHEGKLPEAETVIRAARSFVGDIMQTPPMYSALKVAGKKLCDLARNGVEIERNARPVTVERIDVETTDAPDEYILSVDCSKGTYIRSLCDDIGKALSCGGVMSSLIRTKSGAFDISRAVSVEELEGKSGDELAALLIPTEELFPEMRKIYLPEFYSKLARCGNEIYTKKLGTEAEIGEWVRLYDSEGKFFAVSRCEEFEKGKAFKLSKMFV